MGVNQPGELEQQLAPALGLSMQNAAELAAPSLPQQQDALPREQMVLLELLYKDQSPAHLPGELCSSATQMGSRDSHWTPGRSSLLGTQNW